MIMTYRIRTMAIYQKHQISDTESVADVYGYIGYMKYEYIQTVCLISANANIESGPGVCQ